jgi:hypothetical protein
VTVHNLVSASTLSAILASDGWLLTPWVRFAPRAQVGVHLRGRLYRAVAIGMLDSADALRPYFPLTSWNRATRHRRRLIQLEGVQAGGVAGQRVALFEGYYLLRS